MAAPIVLPFNNNPASTTIKTASYTVPTGKYAYFIPYSCALNESLGLNPGTQTRTSPAILLNGEQVQHSVQLNSQHQSSIIGGTRTITYNFNKLFFSSGVLFAGVTAGSTANTTTVTLRTMSGASYATAATASEKILSIQGCTSSLTIVVAMTSGSTSTNVGGIDLICPQVTPLWIPSGSVITVPAGVANYLLIEYNNIS